MLEANDPPVIGSVSPRNRTRYAEGSTITFKAEASDEEGDPLAYTWTCDGRTIGTGQEVRYDRLSEGRHTVVLTVDDGITKVTRPVVVEVYGSPTGWDWPRSWWSSSPQSWSSRWRWFTSGEGGGTGPRDAG